MNVNDKFLIEQEIAKTFEIVGLLFSVLHGRTIPIETIPEVKQKREALIALANAIETDRASAARMDVSLANKLSAAQAAVVKTYLSAMPEKFEGELQIIFEQAMKAASALVYKDA